ncbi:ParB/RepB/Spo0J family partition protein [Geomonas edaphica]|uniref:ParB/RepB/Spo0J family partition protein n=1 Tax=Geomonas edaphica TaxID=2570226 RepID=UPI001FE33550|nr:ParB N-terminal domain-containing protein [Geomonas edaphica]
MTAESKDTSKNYKKGKIHDISLELLNRDVDQPRKHFDQDEHESLKKSIADKGLLYPVLFRVDENDNLILVSGERRLKACMDFGQRVDLSPVDESEALYNFQAKYNPSQSS